MSGGANDKFTLAQAFACAWKGIVRTSKGRNFRIQLAFAVLATVLGAASALLQPVLGIDGLALSVGEWIVVLVCFGCVLGGECVNTSIEAVVDLVSPGYNELAGIAKDCAAGGVLICSITSFIIGVVLFLPRILMVFSALTGIAF